MGQIILARAGTTDFDEQDRIVGTLDLPINIRGHAEATSLAEELKGLPIATIYTTAGESARESATLVGKSLGVKVRIIKELKNLDFGLWQGLPVEEVRRKHPKLYKQWEEFPRSVCPPAGEPIDDMWVRLSKALKPVLKNRPASLVVLFAPDPLRRLIRSYLMGINPDELTLEPPLPLWERIEPNVSRDGET